jgi:hypothetical protein
MKLTKKADIELFLKLVKTGAPAKAFRNLGISPKQIPFHLGLIVEYEKVLAEPEPVKESVKKVETKPSEPWTPSSVRSVRKAKVEEKKEEENGED